MAGATGYDLVVPTTYAVTALMDTGLLAPLSPRYLTNLANISPRSFGACPTIPENRYTVPWQWGMTGIAWRSDLVPSRPTAGACSSTPRSRAR